MLTFNDSKNRSWTVKLTVGKVEEIRDVLGLDILDSEVFKSMGKDMLMRVKIIALLLNVQLEEKGVSVQDLFDSLSGEYLKDALDAFNEAYIDFFPIPEERELLRTTMKLYSANYRKVLETSTAEIKSVSNAHGILPIINDGEANAKAFSKNVGFTREASDSTLDPLPTESLRSCAKVDLETPGKPSLWSVLLRLVLFQKKT